MEPIQGIDGLVRFLGDHVQVGFSHVPTDKLQCLTALLAKPAEELQQCLDRTFLPNPQQSLAVFVDLVDQRQIPVTSLPGTLINANRLNTQQILVILPPSNGSLDRAEYMIPSRMERLRHFFSTQSLCPAGRKPRIGFGQSVFTRHPGHLFYHDATVRTTNPAWRIDKKHLVAPHLDKLKTPLRQPVVSRPFSPATGTHWATV